MVRKLYCPQCAERWIPEWKDDEPAWAFVIVHRGPLKSGPPEGHGLSIGTGVAVQDGKIISTDVEFFVMRAISCDSCGAEVKPGSQAVAVTLLRHGERPSAIPWVDEYMTSFTEEVL